MLKPSDLGPTPLPYTTQDLVEVEKQFDAAISAAHQKNLWPARVGNYRDSIPVAAVEAVAARYREFWDVDLSHRDSRAVINHKPTAG